MPLSPGRLGLRRLGLRRLGLRRLGLRRLGLRRLGLRRLGLLTLAGASLLTAQIGGCPSAAASEGAVRRLRFAPGQARIVITDYFSPRHRPPDYALYARAGERLRVTAEGVAAPGQRSDDALITLYHITFPSGKQYGEKGYDPFDGRLTETGLYRLHVGVNLMASNSDSGRFRLVLRRKL